MSGSTRWTPTSRAASRRPISPYATLPHSRSRQVVVAPPVPVVALVPTQRRSSLPSTRPPDVSCDTSACSESTTTKPSVRLTVRGTVESITASEIKVKPSDGTASQTCTIGERKPEHVEVNDKVEMTCLQREGKFVLEKISERH